jgi:hypothetical protein
MLCRVIDRLGLQRSHLSPETNPQFFNNEFRTGAPRASEKRIAQAIFYIGLIEGASHNAERKDKKYKVEANDAKTISLSGSKFLVYRHRHAHVAFLS